MAEGNNHHKKNYEIPIRKINISVIESEFNSVRQNFESAMKKMEENLNNFHDQVQKQAQILKQNITGTANQTARTISQHLNSPLVVEEEGKKFLKVRFNVSDFAPDEVKVEVIDDKLVVQARHEEKTDTRKIYKEYRNEFSLPSDVKPDKIEPVLSSDGILTVIVYLAESETNQPENQK